jgi:hypothetical protein
MSNSFDPNSVPVAAIEDSSLNGAARFQVSGRRLHKRWLGNMYGAFLTALDEEGRILFFAGGALRRKVTKTTDEVVLMTPEDIYRGTMGIGSEGAFQPEYKVITLEGPDKHRDYPLEFRDCPFLSAYLGRQLVDPVTPQEAEAGRLPRQLATSWGILRVGPARDKMMDGFKPNGTNAELFLEPRTWKESAVAGSVPGSGSNNLTARLSPYALSFAENYPSAWSLAVSSAYLFGGMTIIPTATPIQASTVVSNLIDHETQTRLRKKAAMEVARAARIAAERAGSEVGGHMNLLRSAIDPATMAAMESKVRPPEE